MINAVKIRVFPAKEQEELMWKSVDVARYTYNWAVTEWKKLCKEVLLCKKRPHESNQ